MSRTIGVGVDLVSLERLELEQERFAERLLTPAERSWCASSPRFVERLAGRLAAKEAVLKALVQGFLKGSLAADRDSSDSGNAPSQFKRGCGRAPALC